MLLLMLMRALVRYTKYARHVATTAKLQCMTYETPMSTLRSIRIYNTHAHNTHEHFSHIMHCSFAVVLPCLVYLTGALMSVMG